jgi:hypothetical protein
MLLFVVNATFTVVNAWFYNCIILIFLQVWSGGPLRANYNLHHVDPTVQSIAFKLTVIQVKIILFFIFLGTERLCIGELPLKFKQTFLGHNSDFVKAHVCKSTCYIVSEGP